MEGSVSVWTLLLCLVLSGAGAVDVNIPQPSYEYARGANITLPCSFTTLKPYKLIIISWSVHSEQPDGEEVMIVTYYSSEATTDVDSSYEGRVAFDLDIAANLKVKKADLKLSSISLSDNRVFECRVQIPGDTQGKVADTTRLVVLVPPSPPVCKIQGTAEFGENINLTCVSAEGSPAPTYKWESRDVQNMPRVPDPKTTDKGGILSLYNISKDTSGYYICTSSNKIRSATCNITLAVMPPSMKIGSTAGIIGGVVAAVLALIIIIYCCCCRQKKNKKDDYAMGVREEEYHDKEQAKSHESHKADGQEDIHSSENSAVKSSADGRDNYEERNEKGYDRRKDYDDRRSDYDDRRSDNKDRRSDYDDRRRDHDDRRSDYDDRRRDYDDRRSDYSDRRDKYSDRHERYDDNRRYDDRYDEPYDDRDHDRPPVPANKPPRRN
ncbi:cell surface A33 antigen-like [Mastacembelus armatus]|uniref:Cell surface A33 antigen-like n=1 Tax=Mastacembelus armatus TaxID=205130 RepID=A0A3Q3S0R7_9TELE|nr:cell surface A33 antigen-like [Mastacembelus armatus]